MNRKTKIEKLAKILSEVHGHCYGPFYESGGETSEEQSYSWDKLPEKSLNIDDVDKCFFRKMTAQIIEEIRNK